MTPSPQARQLFADALADQGPAWANAAESVRAGYRNAWIVAGMAATERALREGADDDDVTR